MKKLLGSTGIVMAGVSLLFLVIMAISNLEVAMPVVGLVVIFVIGLFMAIRYES